MNISVQFVAKKLNLKIEQVNTVLQLLADNATVPFIARYRQGVTGGLDEETIVKINDMYVYNVELEKRKEAIIEILKENKMWSEELQKQIELAETKAEVENIYEPFKIGKKTKATEAMALGLEPLAKIIFETKDEKFNPLKEAEKYLNDKVTSVEFAIEQAQFIISQWICQDVETRKYVKDQIFNYGLVETKLKKDASEKDERQVYKQYYEFSERIKTIPNYRVLAINRAENEKILNYNLTYNEKIIIYNLNQKYFKVPRTGKIIYQALEDSLERLIYPSITREIKSDLFERAQSNAIELFANNVENMLLWPAVRDKVVLALDPGEISGCKLAVLDKQGNVLETNIVYLIPKRENFNKVTNKKESPETTILNLIINYNVDIVVIGNGTASRETEDFINQLLKDNSTKYPYLKNVQFAVVSEVGASVYSAGKIANEEFPELEAKERSAINIGRRFQDPLNELIKIDPKSIGVGQYQHDVNQKQLTEALDFKVNKVVNMVGVDLNTATKYILTHISGLSSTVANNIVEHRKKIKQFKNREELLDVKGLGQKSYEQAVGFLRIHDSENFFDRTAIHPESYKLANQIVEKLNLDLENIDQNIINKVNYEQLTNELKTSVYDVKLIIESLVNPTKDIRDEKDGYILQKDVLKFEDVKPGMILNGTVDNVTDFGIFVYIGIKYAVLVHISNMKKDKNHFIKHPSEVVSAGDKVTIKIKDIDIERKRIQGQLIYND